MPYTPEKTKASIFDAAVEEFAKYGFAGARIDNIAALAGVDKTAIYAHFGNKRALFTAVLADQLGQLSQLAMVDLNDIPESVGRLFDYQRAHPKFIRLLMWEALEFDDGEVPDEASRTVGYRRRASLLADARPMGHFTSTFDPAGMWLLLAGMVNLPLALPQVTRMTIGAGSDELDRQRALLVEAVRKLIS